MAFQRVAVTGFTETTTTTASATLTNVNSGDLIIAYVGGYSDGVSPSLATTASDNQGNTLTRAAHAEAPTDGSNWAPVAALYYIVLPAGYTTYTVTATLNTGGGSNIGVQIALARYTGQAASPLDQNKGNSAGNAGATTAPTTTSTPTDGANTRLAASVLFGITTGGVASGLTENGGANWPTGTGASTSTGGQVAWDNNNQIANDSMNDAWKSATASNTWACSNAAMWYAAAIATFVEATAVQTAFPASDISVGGWTTQAGGTTNLFAVIDETSPNDADYARSAASPSSDTLEVQYSAVTAPGVTTGHVVHYRIARI